MDGEVGSMDFFGGTPCIHRSVTSAVAIGDLLVSSKVGYEGRRVCVFVCFVVFGGDMRFESMSGVVWWVESCVVTSS